MIWPLARFRHHHDFVQNVRLNQAHEHEHRDRHENEANTIVATRCASCEAWRDPERAELDARRVDILLVTSSLTLVAIPVRVSNEAIKSNELNAVQSALGVSTGCRMVQRLNCRAGSASAWRVSCGDRRRPSPPATDVDQVGDEQGSHRGLQCGAGVARLAITLAVGQRVDDQLPHQPEPVADDRSCTTFG